MFAQCARILAQPTCGTACVVTFSASSGGIHLGKNVILRRVYKILYSNGLNVPVVSFTIL